MRFPWATLARATIAGLIMFGVLHFIFPGRRLLAVGVRIPAGTLVYGGVMFLIDSDARASIRKGLRKAASFLPAGNRR